MNGTLAAILLIIIAISAHVVRDPSQLVYLL